MRKVLAALLALSLNVPAVVAETPLSRVIAAERQGLGGVTLSRLERLLVQDNAAADSRYTQDWLDRLPATDGGKQWQCLAEALYFEARGETVKGQFAVAEVIMNRAESPRFPATVCAVVNQGTGAKHRCQFSYTCDGLPETMSEADAADRAGKIARLMVDGAPRPLTKGATYYHAKRVSPRWSRKFARTATIGVHHFYKPMVELSRN